MGIAENIKPELLILIPMLAAAGKLLKDGKAVSSKHIPLILGAASVVMSCAYLLAYGGESAAQAVVTGIVQGVLVAGAAVYGHQIVKQYTDKTDNTNLRANSKDDEKGE